MRLLRPLQFDEIFHEKANLVGASLRSADLRYADLRSADLEKTHVTEGALTKKQLKQVKNADKIQWGARV